MTLEERWTHEGIISRLHLIEQDVVYSNELTRDVGRLYCSNVTTRTIKEANFATHLDGDRPRMVSYTPV